MGERLLSRGSEKAVDVLFLNAVIFGIEFTLDGVELFGALSLGYKINTRIFSVKPLFLCPVRIRPELAVKIRIGGFVTKIGEDQLFKIGAFFSFCDGGVAVSGEKVLKIAHLTSDKAMLCRRIQVRKCADVHVW